jgi:enediyne biosynthesis protein E8
MPASETEFDARSTMVLEAFADTIVPGEKRWPGDRAVAGAATGGGAVTSGALQLLRMPAGGLAPALDALVIGLDEHATGYAARHGLALDEEVPPFVALPYPDRMALVDELTRPGHPEQAMWVGLAIFSNMAFDSAAHLSTPAALADGHPGLLTIGYAQPGAGGLYRFPTYSYGRVLADIHPDTTPTGHPA